MMDRRRFLLTASAGAVARPLVAGAQQMRKVPRIGFLSWGACPGRESVFGMAFRDAGYI